MQIILIRHGQTAWNVGSGEERFRGRTDLPLDGTGRAQAQAVAQRLRDEPIAAVYASPLMRARQTAAPLAAALGLPVVDCEGLLDINYGDWQGLTHAEARSTDPELYRLWRTAPCRVRFPGGESLEDVRARLLLLLEDLTADYPNETVVLVGHQIVNKVLICTLLGLDLDRIWCIGQETAAINRFRLHGGLWHVLALNDTCHLR